MTLKAGFQEKLLFFSFFGVWGFSLSRYLIQAAISGASRHLSKNARQTGDTISSNINTLNSRYRKGALEGGKGLKLDHVKQCVIPHRTDRRFYHSNCLSGSHNRPKDDSWPILLPLDSKSTKGGIMLLLEIFEID